MKKGRKALPILISKGTNPPTPLLHPPSVRHYKTSSLNLCISIYLSIDLSILTNLLPSRQAGIANPGGSFLFCKENIIIAKHYIHTDRQLGHYCFGICLEPTQIFIFNFHVCQCVFFFSQICLLEEQLFCGILRQYLKSLKCAKIREVAMVVVPTVKDNQKNGLQINCPILISLLLF